MLLPGSLLFFVILIFKFNEFVTAPTASITGAKSITTNGPSSTSGTKSSIFSTFTRSSSGSGSSSRISLGYKDIVLDVNANEISDKLEVSTSIPGILKYTVKSGVNASIKIIKGNGGEVELSKKAQQVFCTSPFDGHLTVLFEDQSSDEFFLEDDGFKKLQDESDKKSEPEAPKPTIESIDLDLETPSTEFTHEQIKNIKCYKPPSGKVIAKIKVSNTFRILENDVQENFVCFLENNGEYSILVANRVSEKEWTKYTLSKRDSKPILMDITLIRKFDEIDPQIIFVDVIAHEEATQLTFDNLIFNDKTGCAFKSKSQANKEFKLEFKDSNEVDQEIQINFHKKFIPQEQLTLHSIKSNQDNSEMIFTYVKENILTHEKYVQKEGKFEKDLSLSYGFNLERTKGFLDKKSVSEQNVLFLKTLVPDSVDQGIKISHHGSFKVFHFDESVSRSTFLILPNLEIYLDKGIKHKLVISENGSQTNMVLNTTSDQRKVHYIITTDKTKGNPFSIQARVQLDSQ
uniref:Uncharacterized protein n=1 Tax=Theileria annulata TaxID=5874 RepID=A0A3B0N6H1_THEAN